MLGRHTAALGLTTVLGVTLALLAPVAPVAPGVPERGCPEGYLTLEQFLAEEHDVALAGRDDPARALRAIATAQLEELGLDPLATGTCVNRRHPESLEELTLRAEDRAYPRAGPAAAVRPGAMSSAIAQRQALQGLPLPEGAAGMAEPYGVGPLISNDFRFGAQLAGQVVNAGRIDDLKHDPGDDPATLADDRIFAAVGTGGVWLTEDLGATWQSLNAAIPDQTTSAIAWTPSGGDDGSLVVLSGDSSYGSNAFTGSGAYVTRDLGQTWERSEGIPDGALAFAAEVHPQRPDEIWVGTSHGLFRSTDAGATFAVVPLPVGATNADGEACDGVTDIIARPDCTFANHVTDVVIQSPGGSTDAGNGEELVIVAALGWRGGQRVEGGTETMQAPQNGIYRSTDDGATFAFVPNPPIDQPVGGFAEQERVGRIELGPATGTDQDHGYLYAAVQDAVALNGGIGSIDVPEGSSGTQPVGSTNLEGLYVSPDFGATWTRLVDGQQLASNPANGSALTAAAALTNLEFQPGVQAWYNLCIQPDPSPGNQVLGVPTRVVLCLEEVFQSEDADQGIPNPQDGIGDNAWKVIGRYFSGDACQGIVIPTPCPTDRTTPNTLTTHADQQAVLFLPIPEGDPVASEGTAGGVHLFMGNDGGAYRNTVGPGEPFDNAGWGPGVVQGFNTLLPYGAGTARDGTVWFGLQDNGSGFIDPQPNPSDEGVDDPRDGQTFLHYEAIGGDGFFTEVDPDDSAVAYTERPFASMTVTTDRGVTHTDISPPITHTQFSNPFQMDPDDAEHLLTAGCQVVETTFGPGTGGFPGFEWTEVFQLGDLAGGPCPAAGTPANQVSAVDLERDAAYVGFCGVCDVLNTDLPFARGLATNVGTAFAPDAAPDLPLRMTSQGWHVAAAEGLPNRVITAVEIDPQDTATIYVTLGGYSREWVPPGSLGVEDADPGEGHLFVSRDAGQTFTDISSNLPDVTATWVAVRGDRQLIVGTDIGAFLTGTDGVTGGDAFVPMPGLPAVPVSTIEVTPQDRDLLTLATYGRGIWQYRFDDEIEEVTFPRLGGAERVATSVQVSREAFPRGTDTVVVATAQNYADALIAVPLAHREHAPVLLTYQGALHPDVAAEVQRLGATRALIVGGTLDPQVDSDLRAAGVTEVERLAGADRFATAALVAAELVGSDGATPQAYVVEGADPDPARGWPDAMAIGPLAAVQGRPILLVTTDEVPAVTAQALTDLGVEQATVIGGTVAVSDGVRQQLADGGLEVLGIAGANRYETSALIALRGADAHLDQRRLWLATGDNFPDSLSGGAAVAQNGGVLLLVPRDDLDNAPASVDAIRRFSDRYHHVRLIGGTAAISDAVVDQVREAIAAGVPPPPESPPLVGEVVAGPFGFETGAEGWETFPGSDGLTMWRTGPPGDGSAQSFQVVPYGNETSALLVSPPFEHAGGPLRVTFGLRLNTEDGFDFLSAGYVGGGEANIAAGFTGMNADYPAFTPSEATFSAPPGEVRVFLRLSSDQLINGEGAYVDDVLIER